MPEQKPLTKKAKAAISKYVSIRSEKNMRIMHFLIEDTLKADRMPREQLYGWLEGKGYRWNSKAGIWIEKKK